MDNNIVFNISLETSLNKLREDLNTFLGISEKKPVEEVCVEYDDIVDKEPFFCKVFYNDDLELLTLKIKENCLKLSRKHLIISLFVIIGEYELFESGILKLEKCVGEFRYDSNMELIDIEFIKLFAV